MSAFPPLATIERTFQEVRFVPISEVGRASEIAIMVNFGQARRLRQRKVPQAVWLFDPRHMPIVTYKSPPPEKAGLLRSHSRFALSDMVRRMSM
jgi:hypothetical protein